MEITKQEFDLLRTFIYNTCGLVINDDKKYLIVQRIGPLAKDADCKTFGEYYHKLKSFAGAVHHKKLIDAITTNETSFFRDTHPFEVFKDSILPDLIKNLRERKSKNLFNHNKINIWCAASSTGQEPYSLAMLIREYLDTGIAPDISVYDFKILATDISEEVLNKAKKGVFNSIEVSRGLPANLKMKYFQQQETTWQLDIKIRNMVEFKQVNLVKPFTTLGTFDFIICRNVLIYFDDETKANILNQFYRMLSDEGTLMLGAMENTYCLTDKFKSKRLNKTLVYLRA